MGGMGAFYIRVDCAVQYENDSERSESSEEKRMDSVCALVMDFATQVLLVNSCINGDLWVGWGCFGGGFVFWWS